MSETAELAEGYFTMSVARADVEKLAKRLADAEADAAVLRAHLAYALGMCRGAGVDYPSWLDDSAFSED
jgi:hypothetical protein